MQNLKALGLLVLLASSASAYPPANMGQAQAGAIEVRLVSDEPEAALSIIEKRKANVPITDSDWRRLFTCEGYIRLRKREAAMRRPLEEADFKTFLLSDDVSARAGALAETLDKWKRADLAAAARRAMTYLPQAAQIHAKIYPEIKPAKNSFVFDVDTDPAIFLYIDPEVSREKFENTLAHELHHIGYGSTCPTKQAKDETGKLPQPAQVTLRWVGAFGEGFAMLAAAGGPDIHPHAVSEPEDRARWDRDMGNFNSDLRKVEGFFLEILAGKLKTQEAIGGAGSSFFGIQGPWYTVGWKMAVTIEETYGRTKLIECMCDQIKLLSTYNQAATVYNRSAKEPLALWSPALLQALQGNQGAAK